VATIIGTSNSDYLSGSSSADTFYLKDGNDLAFGGYGNDVMYGEAGSDSLYGQGGNDSMYGGSGYDYLSGGDGHDLLVGGANADYLSGGFGYDTFRMGSASDASGDTIYDFTKYQDKIDLSGIDAVEFKLFSSSTWGNQSFTFIHNDSFYKAGQLRAFQSGGNTYVQGSTDSDSAAEFTIKLSGLKSLSATDFYL
jgi:Ca2+-binding RTX toxin-like protein